MGRRHKKHEFVFSKKIIAPSFKPIPYIISKLKDILKSYILFCKIDKLLATIPKAC